MSDAAPQEDKPQIELASDEDWKTRVKAEDAKRDEESKAASAIPQASQESEGDTEEFDESQLPPASFLTLLQMLSTQAIVALGMIPSPDGQTTVHLPIAKHFIDLLSVIETKSKGNLSADEARFLEGTLHELRMAFVDVTKKQSGK